MFNPSPNQKHQNLLIYFHGNAEDASYAEHMIMQLACEMQAHSLIMEYPGYGVYTWEKPNEDTICEDALEIYNFVTNGMGFRPENIILVGRSMGSGPASFLATEKTIKLVILISPYKSIKTVAKDHFPILGFLVKERFQNIKRIQKLKQPLFILHGQAVD